MAIVRGVPNFRIFTVVANHLETITCSFKKCFEVYIHMSTASQVDTFDHRRLKFRP